MGRDERRDAACSTITRCDRMYQETRNPYFVLDALFAARWGEFTPPEWALAALLQAVEDAMRKHLRTNTRISLDDALGLALSRGKTPCETRAHRTLIERRSFALVRTIRACFDVAAPEACEIAYSAIDFDFARSWEEDLWQPRPFPEKLPPSMTREQWNEFDAHSRIESERQIAALACPDAVKRKMMSGSLWSVTHGDQLGYGLEQFIDRYYRAGSKQRARLEHLGQVGDFLEGHFLLQVPEHCTREITLADVAVGYRPRSVSAVTKLQKRPEFEQFLMRFRDSGSK